MAKNYYLNFLYELLSNLLLGSDSLEIILILFIEFVLSSLVSSSVSSDMGMDTLLRILTCGGPCGFLSWVSLYLMDRHSLSCLLLAIDMVETSLSLW